VNQLQSSREWIYALLAGSVILLALIIMPWVPFLFFLLPLPFILMSAKYQWSTAMVTLLVSGIGWFIMTGDSSMWYILLYSAIVGGLIGYGYRRNQSAWNAIVAGVLGSLGTLIGYIVVSLALFQKNWIIEFQTMIQESIKMNQEWLDTAGIQFDVEQLAYISGQWGDIVPFLLIAFSIVVVALNHIIANKLLNKWGGPAPALPPIHEWQIPKSIVYYYVISFLISLWIDVEQSTFMNLLILNILPLLTFVLAIQGLSFIYYWAHIKKRGKWIPRLSVVLLFIFPPIAHIYNLIGILDLGFPLRKSIRG
jgi:uncharacterized protein YybS (DUF2232 family)